MKLQNKRLHALLPLLALSPIWWIQSAGSTHLHSPAVASASGGGSSALPDDGGCTLTQGYWKNHSAHADNQNQNIPWPISEETLLCGETWFDILHTPPSGGNAWIILAHQWIAARLNAASGASTDDLGDALDDAGDLLAGNCGGLSGDARDDGLRLASLLENYNSGVIGPGHCGDVTDCNGNGISDATDIDEGSSVDADGDGIPDECQPGVTSYCQGTGTANAGVDCPCGNSVPPGSPAGCLNRTGQGATLTGTGNPSVSNDTLLLTATGLPTGVPGYFFQGDGPTSGNVFGNGVRCIQQFIRLRKIAHSTGRDTYPVPGGLPISEEFDIPAGATKFYQVMYRDNGGPCAAGVNATNALRVVWGL